jgi:hypothetical protein
MTSSWDFWAVLTVEIQVPIEKISLIFPTLFQRKCLSLFLVQEMFLARRAGNWYTEIFSDLLSGPRSAFFYYLILIDGDRGTISLVRNPQRIDTAHHGSVQVRFVGVGVTFQPRVNPAFDKVKSLSKEWG